MCSIRNIRLINHKEFRSDTLKLLAFSLRAMEQHVQRRCVSVIQYPSATYGSGVVIMYLKRPYTFKVQWNMDAVRTFQNLHNEWLNIFQN
jgi:uncharacterized protein (DUF488 family)